MRDTKAGDFQDISPRQSEFAAFGNDSGTEQANANQINVGVFLVPLSRALDS